MRKGFEHVKRVAAWNMWKIRVILAGHSGGNFIDSAIFSQLRQHYINVYDIDSG